MSDTLDDTPKAGIIARLFTAHPETVDETYFQHMRFAASFAFWLLVAAVAATIHAIIPALCETTASRILARLTNRMAARH